MERPEREQIMTVRTDARPEAVVLGVGEEFDGITAHGRPPGRYADLVLAVGEAVSNSIEHRTTAVLRSRAVPPPLDAA